MTAQPQKQAQKTVEPKKKKKKSRIASPIWQRMMYRNHLYSAFLRGSVPTSLAIVPPDAWPGNSPCGRQILNNKMSYVGFDFVADPTKWKLATQAPIDWHDWAHGFEWLRDLRSIGGDRARRQARTMVTAWLDEYSQWDASAWQPMRIGARLSSWVGQHNFFIASADDAFRERVFDSIIRQSRHLSRILPDNLKGSDMITALKGLIYACLAFPTGEGRLFNILRQLEVVLAKQILPDGGQIERNPTTHIQVVRDLIDIRNALTTAKQEVPEIIPRAISMMAPLINFYRHGDGKLALFNGGYEGNPLIIDMILNHTPNSRMIKSAPHSAYERLTMGRTTIIFDAGYIPPKGFRQNYHASPLAFELSNGKERLIVNCGHAGKLSGDKTLSWALRTSAAHSTVTVADSSAIDITPTGTITRRAKKLGAVRSAMDDGVYVSASHDGYGSNLGLVHQRQIYMADNGEDIRGEDTLTGEAGHECAIRFHLHPDIKCLPTGKGKGALLQTKSGAGWRFKFSAGTMAIEESLYCPTPFEPPRKTQQLVIYCPTLEDQDTVIKWILKRDRKKG